MLGKAHTPPILNAIIPIEDLDAIKLITCFHRVLGAEITQEGPFPTMALAPLTQSPFQC